MPLRLEPPRPHVRQLMMMSKRATMPLMMAVQTEPMACTMVIRTLPIVRKILLIWWGG